MKIFVTIIPTSLVTSSLSYLFLSFHRNQKQESNVQQVSGLVTRDSFAFCLWRVALYFKGMPNSIDFYKSISLHVIPVRIIVPCFEYVCTAWYPNFSKKLKDKLQVTQNKCIRFCLKLQSREHLSNKHFHKLNWLPINHKFKQCATSTVFKFVKKKCPAYMKEVFRTAENIRINARNSFLKLNNPFRKTSTGQNGLSYIGPAIWNRIPEILKKTKNLRTFKHKVKQYYLNDLSTPNL